MKEIKIIVDNETFIVNQNNGSYQYYKLVDGVGVLPNKNEIKKLLEELQKLNLNTMNIKEQIEELIKNNKIKNIDELKEYLNSMGVKDNIDEYIKYGSELLNTNNLDNTPIDILRDNIIDEIRNNVSQEKKVALNFNVRKDLGKEYVEFSMISEKNDLKYEYPKKIIPYNEDVKIRLIEPIIIELILKSKITYNKHANIDSLTEYKANYYLGTTSDCFLNVYNIEQDYAKILEKMGVDLQNKHGSFNNNELVDEVNNDFEREGLELENDGPKLVLKKNEDKKGFASFLVILLSEFMATLFILLQIVLL